MRPILKPALRLLWRDASSVQLGAHPERALLLAGVSPREARWVAELDGTRTWDEWLAAAIADGVTEEAARGLMRALADGGALDDATAVAPLAALPVSERDRLAPDLAALSLSRRSPGSGALELAARGRASVEVRGLGRLGASVATLLAASGVGRVVPSLAASERRALTAADAAPAGVSADLAGADAERAVREAITRAAPSTRTAPGRRRPDLVILTDPRATAADRAQLVREGQPHLQVELLDNDGSVGPLVVPGRTACGRCRDLHRADRDPAWPRLLVQLLEPGPACDVTLATLVAATAAREALSGLAWFSGRQPTAPATVDGSLELTAADWRLRRRSWPTHPACGCGWRAADEGESMTG